METLDCIHTRRSVRKYLDVPVEWEKVVQILEAGRRAPCSGNLQEWKFIIVTEKEKRHAISDLALQQRWLEVPPVLIIVCADIEKTSRFYGIRGERLYSIQNCAAAIENMLLAAHDLGLASCWIGAFDENALQRELHIPDHARAQAIIPLGYADEKPEEPDRFQLTNVVFFEKYGRREKDMEAVLWNANVVGKMVDAGKRTIEGWKKKPQTFSEKIKEHLKRHPFKKKK